MSKKKSPSKIKRTKNRRLIDHIPNCRRKPRTATSPIRRTEFSSLSISKFHSNKGLFLQTSKRIDKLTTVTVFEKHCDERKGNIEFPLAAFSSSQDIRRRLFSNSIENPAVEVESVGQNALFEASNGRNFYKQNGNSMRNLALIPDKSQVTESSSVTVTPGSVVWAKTASHHWWPAEVMGDRSTVVDSPNESVDGNVLILYYGTRENVWLDPAKYLSEFDECFEERSSNLTDEFQDALKQALHQREHQNLSKQFSGLSDDCCHLNYKYQTPDKWNSSSSRRTESPCEETRRGKRERKPKVHFDEEPLPLTLARGVRRIRIMRSLGLAAPDGSPF